MFVPFLPYLTPPRLLSSMKLTKAMIMTLMLRVMIRMITLRFPLKVGTPWVPPMGMPFHSPTPHS